MRNQDEIINLDRLEYDVVREAPEYYEVDVKYCQVCGEPLPIDIVFKTEDGEEVCAECKANFE